MGDLVNQLLLSLFQTALPGVGGLVNDAIWMFGSLVHVDGRLRHRSWEGQDGQKRYTSEVVAEAFLMLGARPEPAAG